jgi:O-antigen/teichoic acid export membrane protein
LGQSSVKTLLIQSRLALGLIAVIVSLIYSISAGFGAEMTQAFILFQLSLIPFAVMTTVDTIFIAEEKFSKAVLARMSRIFAIGAFLIPSLLSDRISLYAPVISFSVTLLLCSLIAWNFSLKKLMNQNSINFVRILKFKSASLDTHSQFFRGSFIAASIIAVQLTQGLVAQAFLIREIGEKSMTHFNTSIAIATPAILAFQTLSQLQTPKVANWTNLNNSAVKEQFYGFALKMIIIFTVMICGLWIAEQLGLARWFFPFSNIEVIKLSSILILSHALLNLGTPTIALCQYRKSVRPFFITLIAALPLSWMCQYLLSGIWPEAALLTGLVVFALAIAGSSYASADLTKRTSA